MRFSAEEKQAIANDYAEMTIVQLAEKYHAAYETIRSVLRFQGVKIRSRGAEPRKQAELPAPWTEEDVIKALKKNTHHKDIAKYLDVRVPLIRLIAMRHGLRFSRGKWRSA